MTDVHAPPRAGRLRFGAADTVTATSQVMTGEPEVTNDSTTGPAVSKEGEARCASES